MSPKVVAASSFNMGGGLPPSRFHLRKVVQNKLYVSLARLFPSYLDVPLVVVSRLPASLRPLSPQPSAFLSPLFVVFLPQCFVVESPR